MEFDPPTTIWTPEAEAEAVAFCEKFEGTPHMQRRLIAGRGADCVRFVVGVVQAAGILPPFRWPTYRQDIGLHCTRNWMADVFLEHANCHSVAVADWQPQTGDIGIFKVGNVSNHVGIFVRGRFWHVTVHRAVHHCAVATLKRALQEIIRIDSPGLRGDPTNLATE